MGRYPELEQCDDFKIIKKAFSPEELQGFENDLARYLNSRKKWNAHPLVVEWCEGAMSAEDFIMMCS